MTDPYKVSKIIADYVDSVVAHTAIQTSLPEDDAIAAASARVLQHLRIVIENALRGDPPEDIASFLAQAIKNPPA
jgi:hypothetical protein